MSDLEDRIRAALHDPPRQIPAWPDPMPRIRRAARRQRLKLVVTSAIVAAAAVMGVVALVHNLPVAGSGRSGPGGAFSSKVTRSASPKATRSALPPVGAPGYPTAIYPAAVRSRPGGVGAVTVCPAPVGLVKPPSSARATAAAIIYMWGSANRAALLHASDRAMWPVLRTYHPVPKRQRKTLPIQRRKALPILYAGPLQAARHIHFGNTDVPGWISRSCGAFTADRSYLVVTGPRGNDALQNDSVFVDRAGHLLFYYEY